ncbi:MAG: hypothetical protein DDT29_00874 [Dehalococcoidia bacterium]|nr:hypothetical protein [Bacillota bacterium]
MSEMAICVSELRRAAQALIAAADQLAMLYGASTLRGGKQDAPKPITLEQVRAVLAEKSRDGHTAKVRELLEKHGAAKLSEIDPSEYPALLAEAEALGNG